MSAEIIKLSVPRKYRAWCEECQDGYQGGKQTVDKWTARHDAQRHTEEKV